MDDALCKINHKIILKITHSNHWTVTEPQLAARGLFSLGWWSIHLSWAAIPHTIAHTTGRKNPFGKFCLVNVSTDTVALLLWLNYLVLSAKYYRKGFKTKIGFTFLKVSPLSGQKAQCSRGSGVNPNSCVYKLRDLVTFIKALQASVSSSIKFSSSQYPPLVCWNEMESEYICKGIPST